MLTESAKNLVPKFFDETGSTYDGVVSYGTLGKDKYWKKEILRQISNGNSFLDLACGTGLVTKKILTKVGNGQVYGVDSSKSALDIARKWVGNKKICTSFLEMLKQSNLTKGLT